MLVAKTSQKATNFTICNQPTGCYVHHPGLVAKTTSWATNFTICDQPTEWSKWTNNGAGFISVLRFASLFFSMDLTVASQWVWSDHHSLPKSHVCIGDSEGEGEKVTIWTLRDRGWGWESDCTLRDRGWGWEVTICTLRVRVWGWENNHLYSKSQSVRVRKWLSVL